MSSTLWIRPRRVMPAACRSLQKKGGRRQEAQQRVSRPETAVGQRCGLGSRTPDSSWLITCPLSSQKNGCWAIEKISHAHTPGPTRL
ncbi:hypothetical protein EYF80_037174 [Liparis tanakae]|uniref:Uncharacterized protein n=1 Tax=Liparis tanakae TaxID=230148 RepID=A0A4Z2GGJ5_9TELE|nr:hypothetical protein EYF80_037174 [Liparis tanakae]